MRERERMRERKSLKRQRPTYIHTYIHKYIPDTHTHTHTYRYLHIYIRTRGLAASPGVNADHRQHLPHPCQQSVGVEVEMAGHDHAVGLPCEHVELLECHGVGLVVAVQALDVAPVAFEQVNKVVDFAVFAEDDLAVVALYIYMCVFVCVLCMCVMYVYNFNDLVDFAVFAQDNPAVVALCVCVCVCVCACVRACMCVCIY